MTQQAGVMKKTDDAGQVNSQISASSKDKLEKSDSKKPIAVIHVPIEIGADLRILGKEYVLVTKTREHVSLILASLGEDPVVKVDGDHGWRYKRFLEEYARGGSGLPQVMSEDELNAKIQSAGYNEDQDRKRMEERSY